MAETQRPQQHLLIKQVLFFCRRSYERHFHLEEIDVTHTHPLELEARAEQAA